MTDTDDFCFNTKIANPVYEELRHALLFFIICFYLEQVYICLYSFIFFSDTRVRQNDPAGTLCRGPSPSTGTVFLLCCLWSLQSTFNTPPAASSSRGDLDVLA